jgi:hypothetical protein
MMKMKISVFSIILVSLLTVRGNSQDINVTAAFDTSRIYIGDQVIFTVTVDQPTSINLIIPSLKDTLTGKIEILSGPVTDTSKIQDKRLRIVAKYLVTSFDSGLYQIPPVFAEMKDGNVVKRFFSDYTPLEVARVRIAPPDTTAKIFDIIKPYRAPITAGEILPWLILAAVTAAAIWWLRKFIKNRRLSKPETVAVINPDPAHIIAFRELEKLKDEKIWQKGEIKHYYTRLTDILRQYLENRFKVFSLELTTAETLNALIKTGFKKDSSYALVKTVLTNADLVKFAKYNPVPDDNELHFQQAWDFVLATMEKEPLSVTDGNKEKVKEEIS